MSLTDTDLRTAARDHLRANGIDPDATHERAAFDLAEHMVSNALHLLGAVVPPVFEDAEPTHPVVARWVETFLAEPAKARNLFMLGPTGSGKSHQGYGALRRIVLTMARNRKLFRWKATTFADFNAAMRPKHDDAHIVALEEFQRTGLLLLDDLGAGVTSAWTDDNLYRLIDYRWSHRLPCIVTTNLDGGDIAAVFDERVVSRLNASVDVVFDGPDRRLDGGR